MRKSDVAEYVQGRLDKLRCQNEEAIDQVGVASARWAAALTAAVEWMSFANVYDLDVSWVLK